MTFISLQVEPRSKVQLVTELTKPLPGQSLGKQVRYLLVTRNEVDLKFLASDPFTDEVEVYLHVFRIRVKDWVCREIRGTQIVAPQGQGKGKPELQFTEKGAKPEDFESAVSEGFVLNFSGGSGDGGLLLGLSRDEIGAMVD